MWVSLTVLLSLLFGVKFETTDVIKQSSTSTTLRPSDLSSETILDVPTSFQLKCGDNFWQGNFEALNIEANLTSPPVSLAVAFCEHSLGWLDHLVRVLDVRNTTIYSKCGNPVRNISISAKIVNLRNVGRVDHAYAFHMANLPKDTDPAEVQLFLKDTYPAFHQVQLRRRRLTEVVLEASGTTGFSCGSVPDWRNAHERSKLMSKTWFHTQFNYGSRWSAWHLSSEVGKFRLSDYHSAGGYVARDDVDFVGSLSFEEWFDALKFPLPGPVIQVCYAGTFAAKTANIIASRAIWSSMLKLLERGDNIIEGHYAERSYAAVLMPSLPLHLNELMIHLAKGVRKCSYTTVFCGSLYSC